MCKNPIYWSEVARDCMCSTSHSFIDVEEGKACNSHVAQRPLTKAVDPLFSTTRLLPARCEVSLAFSRRSRISAFTHLRPNTWQQHGLGSAEQT